GPGTMSMQQVVTEQSVAPPSAEDPRPARRALWIVLLRNWTSALALLLLLVIAGAAALASLVSPYDPLAIDPVAMLAGPSAHHLMGTDELGRDILSRTIYGGRVSLGTAVVVVAASAVAGVAMGLIAGYFGGIRD